MIIREATSSDVNEIVQVLIASLGTVDLELSPEIWNFKHVNNPFGASLVLVAEEEGRIIGVRAFMRWNWMMDNKVYNCFRAVDTATHPNHQGKGIFKKLTLKAIEIAQQSGNSFVFNTPNENSRPGYLKMGWVKVNKVNIAIKPAWNSFWRIFEDSFVYQLNLNVTSDKLDQLCASWNERLSKQGKIFTPKSRSFLKWRYEDNPLRKYEVIATESLYVALYVKKRGKISELRIAECIFADEKKGMKALSKLVKYYSNKFGVQIISYSPNLLNLSKIALLGNYGPILTIRKLNLNLDESNDLVDISNWNSSIGDLELF
ncbi:GNAT family N-acetyltransferase [uncultured Christiangramia sp.]|uniref:GNAT family N-acetyltransferase n=1 Tax=uncultured Christiangramia sp. TaxID=503836 RepID=UPI002611053A|nr:GNAT family N-acetyltransferase [uncultured Christiangramia sp.]